MPHYHSLTEMYQDNTWGTPEHPLFGLVGCMSECRLGDREFTTDCYVIAFKKIKSGHIMYGRTKLDHENGSMFFAKPRQILELKGLEFEENGFMIMRHEDYIKGHELFKTIEQYSFFEYDINEALHLSPKEEQTVWELYNKIVEEYLNNPDEYSREIILSHVATILKYAQRYFKRQFIDRQQLSGKTVSKFDEVLKQYFNQGKLETLGLPTVNFMAEKLHLSPRYLSDVLKQETGKTAIELIHLSLISEAKNRLRLGEKSVSEIAFELGFENASYFSRLFKKQSGMTPIAFKKAQLN